jgi:hypothetical protein
LKLFYSLIAAGALLAASASAQVWPKPDTSGNFAVRSAPTIASQTAITPAPVRGDTSAALDVLMAASVPISVTLVQKLSNGLTVSTSQVAVDTTPRSYHFAAPLNFQTIAASPTTALTTPRHGRDILGWWSGSQNR